MIPYPDRVKLAKNSHLPRWQILYNEREYESQRKEYFAAEAHERVQEAMLSELETSGEVLQMLSSVSQQYANYKVNCIRDHRSLGLGYIVAHEQFFRKHFSTFFSIF